MDRAVTPDAKDDGFTLIELLVSVAIISVLSVGASLAVSRGTGQQQSDMSLFQSRYETARQMAVLGQQTMGLDIAPGGLRSVTKDLSGWQKPGQLQRWRGRVSLSADRTAPPGVPAPDLVFLANGQTNAFRVAFGSSGFCESDGWTGLTCSGD
ncbi:pilus assembly FimT family protein [Pacificoceanicola onchidii]|uniref:pilus assembly FimT family protein n=1 Tax=Pacificoceanicola onchidii TaxID=2562685 RepID=UPI0010A43879|nr:type II secretion system protein [Pacificoceanicola onchidii]